MLIINENMQNPIEAPKVKLPDSVYEQYDVIAVEYDTYSGDKLFAWAVRKKSAGDKPQIVFMQQISRDSDNWFRDASSAIDDGRKHLSIYFKFITVIASHVNVEF